MDVAVVVPKLNLPNLLDFLVCDLFTCDVNLCCIHTNGG